MPDRPNPPDGLVAPTALAELDPAGLARALRPLWEDAGGLVARLAGRAFASWTDVIDAVEVEIAAMDDPARAALLGAHPRLGEDPARLRAKSTASWAEQSAGGTVGANTAVRLAELNGSYERRFGFPFVEWVNGRSLTVMIEVIEARLTRDRAVELAAGCAALVAIARDRLRRIESR